MKKILFLLLLILPGCGDMGVDGVKYFCGATINCEFEEIGRHDVDGSKKKEIDACVTAENAKMDKDKECAQSYLDLLNCYGITIRNEKTCLDALPDHFCKKERDDYHSCSESMTGDTGSGGDGTHEGVDIEINEYFGG